MWIFVFTCVEFKKKSLDVFWTTFTNPLLFSLRISAETKKRKKVDTHLIEKKHQFTTKWERKKETHNLSFLEEGENLRCWEVKYISSKLSIVESFRLQE